MYFKQVKKDDDQTMRNLTANDNRNDLKRIISEYKTKQDGQLNKIENIVDAFLFIDSIPEKWGFPDFEAYCFSDNGEEGVVVHHAQDQKWFGEGSTFEEAIIAYANELKRRGVSISA